jgi:hypothetical protein
MTFNIDGSLSVKDPSGASPRAVTGEASGSNFAMHVKDVSGSSGGGSASGGGLSTYYAKPSGTNADATVAYTSATTITVTGLAYTFTAFDIVSIDRFTSANVYVETITPKTHTITVAAGVITVATGAFDAGDLFIVTFALLPKSIDETNDAQDVLVGNPIWDRYDESTVAIANVANGTPSITYISMDGYDGVSVHVEKTGGTDTFDVDYESSNEGYDVTVDWIDTTSSWTSVGGAALTADHIAISPANFPAKGHRVEITTAGGANDADFNLFIKKYKK